MLWPSSWTTLPHAVDTRLGEILTAMRYFKIAIACVTERSVLVVLNIHCCRFPQLFVKRSTPRRSSASHIPLYAWQPTASEVAAGESREMGHISSVKLHNSDIKIVMASIFCL